MIKKLTCLLFGHKFHRQVIFLGGGEFKTQSVCTRCGQEELEQTKWKATTKSKSVEELSD